jgi:hypothetical protein
MGGELTESLSDGTKLMKVYLAIDVPRCAEKEAVEVADVRLPCACLGK